LRFERQLEEPFHPEAVVALWIGEHTHPPIAEQRAEGGRGT
jgi:hypothetical protein